MNSVSGDLNSGFTERLYFEVLIPDGNNSLQKGMVFRIQSLDNVQ